MGHPGGSINPARARTQEVSVNADGIDEQMNQMRRKWSVWFSRWK